MSDVTPAPKGQVPDADTLITRIDRVLNGDARDQIPAHVAALLRWCRRRLGEQEAVHDLIVERVSRAVEALSEGDDGWADEPLAAPDFLVVNAVRHATGRMSHAVAETCDWLVLNWARLSPAARRQVRADLEQAFARDDDARAGGFGVARPLGMDMDREDWERVRALWTKEGDPG